jgi:hypothetical protein
MENFHKKKLKKVFRITIIKFIITKSKNNSPKMFKALEITI